MEQFLSPVAGPSRRPTPRTTSSSSSSTPALASPRKPRPRKREEEEEIPALSDVEELAPSARVPCPLCAARVPIAGMDAHIERGCTSSASAPASAKAQWAGLMGGGKPATSAEPLPSVSYGTLKDKAIKALLLAHKLPAGGARPAWIARHKRWVLLWNANLDRAPRARRGADELRAELRRWEDAQRGKPAPAVPDAGTHARANKGEFARLVAQARPAKAGTPGSSETEAAAG
jgi:E3 ubiquitin-protein ligase RAD18